MSVEANIQIMRECYDSYRSGDVDALLERFDDDVYLIMPEIENVPYGGIWHGKAAAAKFFELLTLTEELTDFEACEFIAQGDRVAVVGRMTSTVRSTGRHFSTEFVHIHTVVNNLVRNFSLYFDTARVLRAYQMVTTALK